VGIQPDDPARPVHPVQAAERPQSDGVVAAEHERNRAAGGRLRDQLRDVAAGLLDLGEEARVLVPRVDRLRDGGADVPSVRVLVAKPRDPGVEPRIADGGRAHVDATAPGAEVERSTDDGHLAGWLQRHGGQG
jgi:hypothetical protein